MGRKNVLPVAQVVYTLLLANVREFGTRTTVGKIISNKSIENTLRVVLQKKIKTPSVKVTPETQHSTLRSEKNSI